MDNSKFHPNVNTASRMRKTACSAFLCVIALLATGASNAADWVVDPVRVDLSEERQTAAIILTNNSDQPTSIQVQVVSWSQVDGKDVYTPSRELLVSPPIFTIPAKSDQVVRAALRRKADAGNELSYRINLQELPLPDTPELKGVQIAMRVGLPVFVQSQKGDAAAKMVWNVVRMSDNTLKLGLKNQGNAHVQVIDFSLSLPGSAQVIAGESGSRYVMAGQVHEWLLKSNSNTTIADGRLRLKVFTDAGDVDTELVLGKP